MFKFLSFLLTIYVWTRTGFFSTNLLLEIIPFVVSVRILGNVSMLGIFLDSVPNVIHSNPGHFNLGQ